MSNYLFEILMDFIIIIIIIIIIINAHFIKSWKATPIFSNLRHADKRSAHQIWIVW
jgi:hypothetical protein